MNTSITTTFIEPLDVLFLRGNKLFGDAGSFGESLIPPWPSVAAGALRSAVLVAKRINIPAFARGEVTDAELGSPKDPDAGSFALHGFQLARKADNGAVERLYPLPADWIVSLKGDAKTLSINALRPTVPHAALSASNPLPMLPLLPETERSKAEGGLWLTQAGWADYLHGRIPSISELVKTSDLWRLDPRVGIGMNNATGSVEDGKLFTAQAISFNKGMGFVADTVGVDLSKIQLLRFGGDGRGATCYPVTLPVSAADYAAIGKTRRMKLVLTAPALFAGGWLPDGVTRNESGAYVLNVAGVKATLVCAAVPRMDVASGWDLAQHAPKAADRVVSAGAVYWFDAVAANADALTDWVLAGLWGDARNAANATSAARRTEGLNRFALATWAP